MGFSLNGTEFTEFSEFRESAEAWIRINLTVFSVSCVCGTVVESLPLTQEIVGSSTAIFWKKLLFLWLNSANSVKTFRENSNRFFWHNYHSFFFWIITSWIFQYHWYKHTDTCSSRLLDPLYILSSRCVWLLPSPHIKSSILTNHRVVNKAYLYSQIKCQNEFLSLCLVKYLFNIWFRVSLEDDLRAHMVTWWRGAFGFFRMSLDPYYFWTLSQSIPFSEFNESHLDKTQLCK